MSVIDKIDKYLIEGFDWDSYDKVKEDFKKQNKKIKIKYDDIFKKGMKAKLGTVQAAKQNLEKMKNIGNAKEITLFRF